MMIENYESGPKICECCPATFEGDDDAAKSAGWMLGWDGWICGNCSVTKHQEKRKMNIPTREQMTEILEAKLASDYPEASVENGENWELIAEIFFKIGFEAAGTA